MKVFFQEPNNVLLLVLPVVRLLYVESIFYLIYFIVRLTVNTVIFTESVSTISSRLIYYAYSALTS